MRVMLAMTMLAQAGILEQAERTMSWQLQTFLVAALKDAIRPALSLDRLRTCARSLQRHLREPPRRRAFRPVRLC